MYHNHVSGGGGGLSVALYRLILLGIDKLVNFCGFMKIAFVIQESTKKDLKETENALSTSKQKIVSTY